MGAVAPGLAGISRLLLAGCAVCLQPLSALQLVELLWQPLAPTRMTSECFCSHEWHSSGKAVAPGLGGISWLLLAGCAVCLQPLAALQLVELLWQPLAPIRMTSA